MAGRRTWWWALALLAAPAQSAMPWREASSAHFVIYSQENEVDLRRFAERLERFDKAMRVIRDVPDEPMGRANRLTVYVVRDVAQVQKLMGDGSRNVAGFYHGRAGGSVAFTPRGGPSGGDAYAQIVLLHEYTHHFMARYFPAAYPAWFVEGFAEFNSTARFEKDGGVGIGLPAKHRAFDLAANGTALPLADLVGDTRAVLTEDQRSSLYARGWLLTHYLSFAAGRKGQLNRYLDAINAGTAPPTAALAAFGPLVDLDRELRAYVLRATMPYVALAAKDLRVQPIAIRLLRPGEQAMLPIAMRSQRGVNDTTAPPLAAEARTAAAPFPADPQVQAALAEAEFDAGDLTAAEAAADRSIAADAKSIHALLYKAHVQLARADRLEGEPRRAQVKAARASAMRANRVDPDDPRPLEMFYATYALLGEAPTANAVLGLTVAHRLAPEDEGLRLTLARQLARDGKYGEVRALLRPIVNDPHGGGARDAARAMLVDLPGETREGAPATP